MCKIPPQDFLSSIKPLLDRVKAMNVRVTRDGAIIATVYKKEYIFELHEGRVDISRGDLKSHFMLSEISLLDHVCMPYLKHAELVDTESAFPEQKASDIAMRLHLIMPGDICLSTEMVIYIGAGTQRSSNYIRAR